MGRMPSSPILISLGNRALDKSAEQYPHGIQYMVWIDTIEDYNDVGNLETARQKHWLTSEQHY